MKRLCFTLLALSVVWGCGFDDTLREYLSAHFWLPFAKRGASFERPNVRRISAPFAGMAAAAGDGPIARARAAYQKMDLATAPQAVAAARADQSLTPREKEEVDLIDAKIDLREGEPDDTELLDSAKKKLEAFLRTARTQEFRSEARGWLGRVHHLLGNQTAAGKIYLDELNRNGSNLSRETLLNSLKLTYGYDGGPELLAHLEEYFDTPEHAAFAIQLATNPHWYRTQWEQREHTERSDESYAPIKALLEKHSDLLQSNSGANALALLAMRTALRMGDPPAARKIADAVPANAAIRSEPDFNWMLASSMFLSREYAAAEAPLLALFRSSRSSKDQQAAAAYGLCGVYRKTGNAVEQIRFALWLHTQVHKQEMYLSYPSDITDLSVYWAVSGWDLKMLLDAEAPIDALRTFADQNPGLADIRLVKYSLAVRLARENRYQESAEIFAAIYAPRRVPRMRRLAALYKEEGLEAKYRLAEFLSSNPDRIYFNDAIWGGFQSYVFQASDDSRLTREERKEQIELERKLKDDQEERWRAWLILRDVVQEAGPTDLGRKAAILAIHCLDGIRERFGRREEIRQAEAELVKAVRKR